MVAGSRLERDAYRVVSQLNSFKIQFILGSNSQWPQIHLTQLTWDQCKNVIWKHCLKGLQLPLFAERGRKGTSSIWWSKNHHSGEVGSTTSLVEQNYHMCPGTCGSNSSGSEQVPSRAALGMFLGSLAEPSQNERLRTSWASNTRIERRKDLLELSVYGTVSSSWWRHLVITMNTWSTVIMFWLSQQSKYSGAGWIFGCPGLRHLNSHFNLDDSY